MTRNAPTRVSGLERAGREGFALPIAMFALALMAVMITGAFHVSHQESRIGVATEHASLAFYLAEQGVTDVAANWDPATYGSVPLYTATEVSDTLSQGYWEVNVWKLSDRIFFLDGTGTITKGGTMLSGARRRVGLVTRILSAELDPPAALVTRGMVDIRGTAEVHGEDSNPPGWDGFCSGSLVDKPGIITDDANNLSMSGEAEVTGSPEVVGDPSIGDETFTMFGDMTYEELTSLASKRFPGGNINTMAPAFNVDGSCDMRQMLNWGDPVDPTSACGSYFPIIHIAGNALIQSGGIGQGILLVDGNLDLRGGFEFHGIVIVQGEFETQGSGNRVYGGVYASNAEFDDQSLVGGSVTQQSTCAVTRAILNNPDLTQARPLHERSWVDLSSVIN